MAADTRVLRGDEWPARLRRSLAPGGDMAQWMREQTRLLKEDPRSQVGLLRLDEQICYLKFYRANSPARVLQFRLGLGRPTRAFDSALGLLGAGVAVPRPLACLAVPGGVLLLMEGIPAGRDLQAMAFDDGLAALRGELLPSSAALLARLHGGGFAHGDCKWSNLLWSGQGLYLVDLDGVSRCRVGSREQARDIARFTLNAEELSLPGDSYEEFLGAYLQASGWQRESLLRAVRPALEKLRARHLARYGERGRRLL